MLGTSLYVLGDTMIVGRGLGTQGLAALNLSIPIINVFTGLGLLCGIGGATALSVDRGKGKKDGLNGIFTKSLMLALIAGFILTLVRVFFLDGFVSFLGASGNTFSLAKDYLGVLMAFATPFVLNTTLMIFVRNDGAPKLAMVSMLVGAVMNILLDYIFIIKFNWQMWGGALATGLAPVFGLVILSTHFIRKQNRIKIERPEGDWVKYRRIIHNGIPSFIIELSAGIVIFAFNLRLLGLAGDLAVSTYSIIANLSLIATAIFTGVGQGIQPIVSTNYGARRMDRALNTIRLATLTSLILGILFFIAGVIFPEHLIGIFVKDPSELLVIGVPGIRIYFSAFLFMGINISLNSYIQSKEKARISLQLSLLRGLVLIILNLFILPIFFGINGVWLTMPLTEILTFAISNLAFKRIKRAVRHSFGFS
ncbi:MAG: MATE family efflux transporter [Clostridiaceae bacterium]|jgi:putative MATE family efflux protein|nr:MATE family efflux transporter [Clostridiaceae bacterium]